MKKLFFIISGFLFAVCIRAQVTQEWVQTFNSAATFYMAMDNAGNIYTAGPGTNSQVLLKYDAMGNLYWSQINPAVDGVNAMAIDGEGEVILAGNTSTVKYDADGTVLWTISTSFLPKSVAIDENNNIYLHGQNMSTGTLQTAKYSPAGIQQWIATYPGDFYASLRKRMVYRDGYVYITGDVTKTVSRQSVRHILTMKYNASTGAQSWAVTYTHADLKGQYGNDVIVDGTGNIYVTGMVIIKASGNKINNNWGTLKYNASGTLQWVKFYDGNGDDNYLPSGSGGTEIPYDIAFDNSGNIIVCGTSFTTTGQFTSQDMTTVKYNSSGTQLWAKTYDDSSHSSDAAQAITSDGSSNVYITGSGSAAGGYLNATTIKYNSAGAVQWTINYNGGTTRALLLDNNTNVYVCGSPAGNSLLIKYSQGGGSITRKDIDPMRENVLSQINLYPNPAIDQITVQNFNNKILGYIKIYDVTGKMTYQKFANNSRATIDIKSFSAGVYFLKADELQGAIKFIIR